MGGCSSKPKTAEFEGAMELQEGRPQDEAARKSLEAEKIGVDAGLKGIDKEQESSERVIQTLLTKERDDLCDVLFNEEKKVLEDDPKNVKKILDETRDNVGKELPVKGESLKLQKDPEILLSGRFELYKDPVLIKEGTTELQNLLLFAIEADTVNPQKQPFSSTEKSPEMEGKHIFSESEILAEPKQHITSVKDASELQVKPTGPQDETLERPKDPVAGEQMLEVQTEPSVPADIDLGLQRDALEEASKGRQELESQEAVYKDKEQALDDVPGKRIGDENKDFEVLGEKPKGGPFKVDSEANDCVLSEERGEDVFENASKRSFEDQNAKGEATEAAAEGIITNISVDNNSSSAKDLHNTAVQQPLENREIDSICVVPPATAADASPNNLHPMVGKQTLLLVGHEEQMQAEIVDAAAGMSAKIFAMSPAEPVRNNLPPTDDFLLKESSGETLDTTLVEGDYIWGKINVDKKFISPLSVVTEEPLNMELSENSVDEVQGKELHIALICNEGQPKSDVSSTSDQVTAPQVTATAERPEAQFVHVKEPAELAFRKDILAQEISAPDIDDVWEKLASEFVRQESLSRSTS